MAIRTLALTLVLAVCLSSQSYAQPCTSPEMFKSFLQVRHPNADLANDLKGEAAASFIDAFNREPPPTSIVADRVLIYRHPARLHLVVFFREGCFAVWGQFPGEKIEQLLVEEDA